MFRVRYLLRGTVLMNMTNTESLQSLSGMDKLSRLVENTRCTGGAGRQTRFASTVP